MVMTQQVNRKQKYVVLLKHLWNSIKYIYNYRLRISSLYPSPKANQKQTLNANNDHDC